MAEARPKHRHARARRTSTAVRIVVTGLVLGFVVFGVGALMNRQGPTSTEQPLGTSSVTSATPGSLATTTPPSSAATGTASGTATVPATGTAGGPDATPVPEGAYFAGVADIASLLPKKVTGYAVGVVETATASAIVSLQPTDAGPKGQASLVVLTVFDKKSVAGAQGYVDTFQRAFPKDLHTVTIGRVTGRFGTDGSHLAAATFSQGRYAFEIVLTATRGAPRDLQALVLQASEAFAASHVEP